MPIPDFQAFFLPLLQFAGDEKIHSSNEAYDAMAKHFQLADEDLREMLPSGKQTTFKNRVAWAKAYLSKALLLESPKRGIFRISVRGKEVLAGKPQSLRVKELKRYPEFASFHQAGNKQGEQADISREEERPWLSPVFKKTWSSVAIMNKLSYVLFNTPAMPLAVRGYAHFGGFFYARSLRA